MGLADHYQAVCRGATMWEFIHADGRTGRGDQTWKALLNAVGLDEADEILGRSRTSDCVVADRYDASRMCYQFNNETDAVIGRFYELRDF